VPPLGNTFVGLLKGATIMAVIAVPDAKWRRLISAVFAANTWEHYEEHLAWHPAAPTR